MTWAPSTGERRRFMAIPPGKLAALFVFAMALSFGADAQAQQFDYSAVLAGQGKISGPVNAGGIVWQCNAKYCTTRGPWPVPGIKSCNALAMIVGQLANYGYKGHMLSPNDMATCNGTKSQSATSQPIVPINPLGALLQNLGGSNKPGVPGTNPPASPLPGFGQQAAIAGAGAAPIRTPTLTVTGTGSLGAAASIPSFAPITIRTTQLQITGTAFYPITIHTTTLTVTGTGSP